MMELSGAEKNAPSKKAFSICSYPDIETERLRRLCILNHRTRSTANAAIGFCALLFHAMQLLEQFVQQQLELLLLLRRQLVPQVVGNRLLVDRPYLMDELLTLRR